MKKAYIGFSIGIFAACLLLIVFLATGMGQWFLYPGAEEHQGTRIVTPREAGVILGSEAARQMSAEESLSTRVPFDNGENIVAVLNRESIGGLREEQFVIYHIPNNPAGTVYIAHIGFDEQDGRYRHMWSAPVAATRVETISIFIQDIIGDRNNCIVITGMNRQNEHTMTIFRQNPSLPRYQPFQKIAEIQIDGSIVIQERTRTLAYHQGISHGQSFTIAAFSQDISSANILDQIETIYSFNPLTSQFEQTSVSRIPGSQIEQRRIREILSGDAAVFENFIHDLWYFVTPQGTIDRNQYIHFNPINREIIFYSGDSQQIFSWQNSTPTRLGLYIRSQNISIRNLRRFIDIELESLDSIRLRAFEDIRLRISLGTQWDGSYRRAGAVNRVIERPIVNASINAVFDSSWGRLQFHDNGEFIITSANMPERRGRYVFFNNREHDLLELRSEEGERSVYRVETVGNAKILSRIRLGTAGIQDMQELPVTLTLVES